MLIKAVCFNLQNRTVRDMQCTVRLPVRSSRETWLAEESGTGISRDKELPPFKGEKGLMTEIELTDNTLLVHIRGADKFWALKSQLKIPLAHVVSAQIDPAVVEHWSKPFKGLPRINYGWWLPGVIKAGSSYREGQWAFWNVHDPHKAIT